MKFHSLAQRLFLVTSLALLPAIAILVSNIVSLHQSRTSEVHAQALKDAELLNLEIERIISGAENVLTVLSTSVVVRDRDAEACSAFTRRIVDALPYLAVVTITDQDGSVWCLPEALPRSVFLGDRPYFQEALDTPERVIGVFTEDRATGRDVLPIALRYVGADGTTTGVVAAYLDLGWLQTTLEEHSLTPGGALTIADFDGRILARTPKPEDFVGTVIPEAFQRLVRAEAPGTEEVISQDGTRRIIGYYPAPYGRDRIYISTGISVEAAFSGIVKSATWGLGIWITGAAAAIVLAAYTSRSAIVRPFNRLVATIDAWRKGDTSVRSGMSEEQGEIGRVGVALDAFMDELLVSRADRMKAEQQRSLIAQELSHRVKNLLTMIQVVARQTFSQLDAKDAVATFSARLRSMASANDLLLDDQWQAAPLRHVIETSLAPFRDKGDDPFTLTGPSLAVSGATTMALGMALHELCTNASKYGALTTKAGTVDVAWAVSDEGMFTLTWAERGGPTVASPTRTGFGSKVIRQVLEQAISGTVEVDFAPAGLQARITAPLSGIAAPAAGLAA